ncbi:hypothetical protein PsYK624_069400 [Phanerochaete sordida]|uniref:MYND-type domain-containing protein n=1 Tax=Phanerochaete sordida TaxID=48140 RepID=A0A9P3G9P9_9APHY|nr:hypothetical protein PsYK624_069400 [Phanerochaete sordida]
MRPSESRDNFSAALNPIKHFDCECHPFAQDWDTDAPKTIRKAHDEDPAAYMRKALGGENGPVDLRYLCILTSDLVEDPDVRTKPVLERFVDMICNGYNVPDRDLHPQLKSCAWERPMTGIVNSLQTFLRHGAKKRPEERASFAAMQSHYKRVLDIIRNDLPKLLPDTKHANHLRLTAVKYIVAFGMAWGLDDELLRDDEVMELFLTLWMHMKHPYRTDVNHFVSMVYGRTIDPSLEDPPADLHKHAVEIIGLRTLTERFREWLREGEREHEHLLSDLKVVEAFAMNREAVGCAFCDARIHQSIANAVNRQGYFNRHNYADDERSEIRVQYCLISETALGTIARMGLCVKHSVLRLQETLEGGGLTQALGAVILEIRLRTEWEAKEDAFFSLDPTLDDAGYFLYLKDLLHPIECKEPHCYRAKTDAFMATFRPHLETMWIPFKTGILHATYNLHAPDVTRRMINIWGRLCTFMGTTEDSVRLKHIREGTCLNYLCKVTNLMRPDSVAKGTKLCSKCKIARYCSVECQREDWKKHKEECNPMSIVEKASAQSGTV